MPSGEWNGDQYGPNVSFVGDDGRTDEERICEDSPDCQFTFPTLANIKRLGAGIGTNP